MSNDIAFRGFPTQTIEFLRGLSLHNDKAWFDQHRDDYQRYYVAPALAFVRALGPKLHRIAPAVHYEARVNGSLFRINRDIRFSKDKSPYKHHLDLWFWEGASRGWESPGFFFRMFHNRLMLGAGMHHFDKEQLAKFRSVVTTSAGAKALDKVMTNIGKLRLYDIGGATRKTVPRGYDAKHPSAKWLLHEGLHATLEVALPKEVTTAKFVAYCLKHYSKVAPVNAWIRAHFGGGSRPG